MDGELKWLVAVVAIVFGGLFVGLVYSEHLEQAVKLECIKAKGQYVKGSCVFRN